MAQQTTERADADATSGPRPGGEPDAVPIERLLTVAVLSPAQAVLVSAAVLADAAPGPDACRVSVDADGAVEVTPAPSGSGSTATELLDEVTRNAHQLPAHPHRDQLALLRTLEEVRARDDLRPDDRARLLEDALEHVLGPRGRERLHRELGSIVDAYARVAAGAVAPPAAGHRATGPRAMDARAVVRPPVGRRATRTVPRRTRPRRRAGLTVVLPVALVLVLGGGFLATRGTGSEEPGAAGDPPVVVPTPAPADASPRADAARRPPPMALLAARRTDQVGGLTVAPSRACTPGTPCSVTTTVRLSPVATTRAVTWRVGTATWCGGRITWSAPVTVTAQPGWTRVFASSTVVPARGGAVALVAVTTAPGRVQSPPVGITGRLPACTAGHAQR